MQCIKICSEFKKKVNAETQILGEIHSIFTSSFNVMLGDGTLITILARNRPMMMNSIKTKENLSFYNLLTIKNKIDIHNPVVFEKTKMYLSNDSKQSVVFDYGDTELWDGRPDLQLQAVSWTIFSNRMSIIADFIKKNKKTEGISSVVYFLADRSREIEELYIENLEPSQADLFIKKPFINFIDAYKKAVLTGCVNNLKEKASKIIGFGIGLTPSMDDFLSGIMITMIYGVNNFGFSVDKIVSINNQVIDDNLHRTTKVSAEMLRHAAFGRTNEHLKSLMISIFSQSSQANMVMSSTRDRLNCYMNNEQSIGETSGIDTLFGVYLGCCLIRFLKEV